MKKILVVMNIIMVLFLMNSCNPGSLTPDFPVSEEQEQQNDSESGQDSNPEPDPEPDPKPDEVFHLVTAAVRETLYNSHKIAVVVKSNCGILVEIPQEATQWISECEGYDRSKGQIGLRLEALPQTMIGDSLIPDTCSNEDREAEILFCNESRTKCVSVIIRQLCYGCSRGIEAGDDIIVEY